MISDEFMGKQFAERTAAVLWSQLSLNPTPQVVRPLLELWANTDSFTGAPIESAVMERMSKSERIGANTSAVAQIAGKIGPLSPVQIAMLNHPSCGRAFSATTRTALAGESAT